MRSLWCFFFLWGGGFGSFLVEKVLLEGGVGIVGQDIWCFCLQRRASRGRIWDPQLPALLAVDKRAWWGGGVLLGKYMYSTCTPALPALRIATSLSCMVAQGHHSKSIPKRWQKGLVEYDVHVARGRDGVSIETCRG